MLKGSPSFRNVSSLTVKLLAAMSTGSESNDTCRSMAEMSLWITQKKNTATPIIG
jgi:hypothetical protein